MGTLLKEGFESVFTELNIRISEVVDINAANCQISHGHIGANEPSSPLKVGVMLLNKVLKNCESLIETVVQHLIW